VTGTGWPALKVVWALLQPALNAAPAGEMLMALLVLMTRALSVEPVAMKPMVILALTTRVPHVVRGVVKPMVFWVLTSRGPTAEPAWKRQQAQRVLLIWAWTGARAGPSPDQFLHRSGYGSQPRCCVSPGPG
jgi:hypothetical protein